ncbi:hypothetical protein DY218_27150 [Streptomyces triticagri]|uniref:Uncharacterized protein n=1 Tax=Streptomyces triticagri TaxID=2293568 RepID=A0A372LY32_9ACTN|nr:hypothetical protein [Streptomyces triticagri]RFU83588.1 hypothetical protein DY218_27150 [Streptomyces triticagri]
MTDPDTPSDCEHVYEIHTRGGHPLHIRTCAICHLVDWADLDQQADEIFDTGWELGAAHATTAVLSETRRGRRWPWSRNR